MRSLLSLFINNLIFPIDARKQTKITKRFVPCARLSSSHKSFLTILNTKPIPKILLELLNGEEWKQTMKAEIEAVDDG